MQQIRRPSKRKQYLSVSLLFGWILPRVPSVWVKINHIHQSKKLHTSEATYISHRRSKKRNSCRFKFVIPPSLNTYWLQLTVPFITSVQDCEISLPFKDTKKKERKSLETQQVMRRHCSKQTWVSNRKHGVYFFDT